MTTKQNCIYKVGIVKKLLFLSVLLLLSNLINIDAKAIQGEQSNGNVNCLIIERKYVDYNNNLYYANIEIQLYLDKNEESLYLVLPIKDTPGMSFLKWPSNSNRSYLSGYLEENENYTIQILPNGESGKVVLSLRNVQLILYKPLDEESVGHFELCFHKTKNNIPEYINNLVRIDEIRIIDDKISSVIPNAKQEGNTWIFDSDDDNISVSIIKEESIDSIDFKLILAVFILGFLVVFVVLMNSSVIDYVEVHKENRQFFRQIINGVYIIEAVFFVVIIIIGYFKELTLMSYYVTAVITSIVYGKQIRSIIGTEDEEKKGEKNNEKKNVTAEGGDTAEVTENAIAGVMVEDENTAEETENAVAEDVVEVGIVAEVAQNAESEDEEDVMLIGG